MDRHAEPAVLPKGTNSCIALLIFLMRIADVSIGTIRTIYTIRGRRGVA